MVLVDVEGFGNPARTDHDQLLVRDGMYAAVETAFAGSDVPWTNCDVSDRGDGIMVLVPADVSKNRLVDRLPDLLATALDEHNANSKPQARIRLRLALHAGEVHHDARGPTSDSLNFAFRLLDAPTAKKALARSSGVLVTIASDWFYRNVIRHDQAASPDSYRMIRFKTKETAAAAWIRLPGDATTITVTDPSEVTSRAPAVPDTSSVSEDQLTKALMALGSDTPRRLTGLITFVEALLAVPTVGQEAGRRLLLQHLRPEVANAVPYSPQSRHHVFALVRTCMNYQDGLDELLAVVHELEGDSLPVQHLDRTVADLVAGYGVD
jgi:hypothetical protein